MLYLQEIDRFRSLAREINSLPTIAYFDMVQLDCDDLKRGLASKANKFADELLSRLAEEHRSENRRIISEYESIKEKAMRVPEDTKEMIELQKFVEEAKSKGLVKLGNNIKVSHWDIYTHIYTRTHVDGQARYCYLCWFGAGDD